MVLICKYYYSLLVVVIMFILHLTIHLKIIVYFYDSLLILSTCHQHLRKSQQSGIRRLPSKQKGKPDFKEWERDWKKWQRKWDCKEREANPVCKEKPDSTKFRIDPFCFNRLCQVARASICSQCISLWNRSRGCFKIYYIVSLLEVLLVSKLGHTSCRRFQ